MYGTSTYTIQDITTEDTKICISCNSPGIDEKFTANITINTTESKLSSNNTKLTFRHFSGFTDFVQLSSSSLEFSVNDTSPSQTECFNLSIEFNDGDICEYFNCDPRVFELSMVLSNETERVNTSNSSVTVQIPSHCACSSDAPSPTFSTTSQADVTGIVIAAIVPSLFVVFAIVAIVVVTIVFYRKNSKLKRTDLEG